MQYAYAIQCNYYIPIYRGNRDLYNVYNNV